MCNIKHKSIRVKNVCKKCNFMLSYKANRHLNKGLNYPGPRHQCVRGRPLGLVPEKQGELKILSDILYNSKRMKYHKIYHS